MSYQKIEVAKWVNQMKCEGLRVFLAEKGTYGFFTDSKGTKIISFQYELCPSFSGNYVSKNASVSGQGWRIMEGVPFRFTPLLNACAPTWAIRVEDLIRYKTIEDQLNLYGKTSKYTEVIGVKHKIPRSYH